MRDAMRDEPAPEKRYVGCKRLPHRTRYRVVGAVALACEIAQRDLFGCREPCHARVQSTAVPNSRYSPCQSTVMSNSESAFARVFGIKQRTLTTKSVPPEPQLTTLQTWLSPPYGVTWTMPPTVVRPPSPTKSTV